jgi:hypothetical protein
MKLSRRGKRTKCAKRTKRTKRTKNIKCRRNTKRHLNKYKRKNTYRKHSHKLRKNKRVMRGGEENVNAVYSKKSVNLKYKTDDSSFMNRARGFMDKFQEGTFRALLIFDKGKLDINDENSVFKKEYTITSDREVKTHYSKIFASPNHTKSEGIYHFTLMMDKEGKTFKVKFTLTVRRYMVYLDTRKVANRINPDGTIGYFDDDDSLRYSRNWETKFNLGELLQYEITYSDGTDDGNSEKTILGVRTEDGKQVKEVDSISIKSEGGKTYTFPFPNPNPPNYDTNYLFFSEVLDSCKEKVLQLMTREIGAIEPKYTLNPNVNEYPSRIIQPPTTPTPTPAPEDLEPSVPVSIEEEVSNDE